MNFFTKIEKKNDAFTFQESQIDMIEAKIIHSNDMNKKAILVKKKKNENK